MGKLLDRLNDASRSGVYRTGRADEILDAAAGSPLGIATIDLRKPVFEAFATALEFPDWFGENWDALEDCLTDLSWRKAQGHVLVIEKHEKLAKDELGVLTDVLRSAAEFWAERGKPFFAVFVDPQRTLELPDLYRES
jgi:RNAse (barnase) inhibitor barstar